MNALMQQFFMNQMFCRGILETGPAEGEGRDNLLYQLKVMFGSLKEQSLGTYNGAQICQSIKDFDGKPLAITEQKDVDEFFNLFLERLEPFLRQTGRPTLIQETFGGSFANEIIGLECPHRSERIEDFLSLSLQVKGKKNLEASLKSFVEEEYLSDKNAYDCDRCEKKIKAKRRTTFKVLPNQLVVVLKRFEFHTETRYILLPSPMISRKNKLNDCYEFPIDLDMEKYTEEFSCKRDICEKPLSAEHSPSSNSITNSSVMLPVPQKPEEAGLSFPQEYYQYRLKGVVLHLGTVESGHYTSLICDKTWGEDAKWYEFNDGKVSEFRVERMPEEAFGGQEEGYQNSFSICEIGRARFLSIAAMRCSPE